MLLRVLTKSTAAAAADDDDDYTLAEGIDISGIIYGRTNLRTFA